MAATASSSEPQFIHDVQFYDQEQVLAEAVGKYVGAALESGSAGIVIATAAHRTKFDERLKRRGLDLEALRKSGQYVALDAEETLAQFMVNGWPDEQLFAETVGVQLTATGNRYSRIRVYGEMVAVLCADKKPEAALYVEKIWNNFGRIRSFSLLCAYPVDVLSKAVNGKHLHHICGEHARVLPTPRSQGLTTGDQPYRDIIEEYEKRAVAL